MEYSGQMTFDYLINKMLSYIPNTVDKREGSIIYDALAPVAAELAKLYIELDIIMDETFVDTASMYYLKLRCKERAVEFREASRAVVEGVFEPNEVEISDGARFNCGEVNFIISGKIADGRYSLECETSGTSGNIHSGFLLPIQNINGLQTAKIASLLIPGEDADDVDTLRKRYYDSLDNQAFGGNVTDYKIKVNSLQGVGGVRVFPTWNGGGTVKLVIISSEYESPSQELIESVQTAIDPPGNHGEGLGIAPVGHVVTVVGVGETPINITTEITYQDGWGWDRVRADIENTVDGYLSELSMTWADADRPLIVRVSAIESRILNCEAVIDIANTAINGKAQNYELENEVIPIRGDINVL